MNKDDPQDELDLVKSGDSNVLKELYKKYRSPFIQWAKWKYPGKDAADVYQQAFTIFYFNVKDGKFTGMKSSIRTYLFGIGKNLLNKSIQETRPSTPLEEIQDGELPVINFYEHYEATHQQQVVRTLLERLGEPCKTILTQFYYDNFTMESIAESMGYKTPMVARKKKCECLMKIRLAMKSKQVQLNPEK